MTPNYPIFVFSHPFRDWLGHFSPLSVFWMRKNISIKICSLPGAKWLGYTAGWRSDRERFWTISNFPKADFPLQQQQQGNASHRDSGAQAIPRNDRTSESWCCLKRQLNLCCFAGQKAVMEFGNSSISPPFLCPWCSPTSAGGSTSFGDPNQIWKLCVPCKLRVIITTKGRSGEI